MPTEGNILGLHHITLVCANAQRTIDFYTQVLGQHLKLPPWLEESRGVLEPMLSPIKAPAWHSLELNS